ncbi:hypothetical protein [Pseudomonas xanthosomatis]|uniref:hypothetical protein n=1 Tax=Pseudomonas xanthosomatis TaxID=2842356 RepID=UPI0035161ABA
MSYFRAAQCFSNAIDILMDPHPNGVNVDLARAMIECGEAIDSLRGTKLDPEAEGMVDRIKFHLNYSHLPIPEGKGGYQVKAEYLGETDRLELSQLVKRMYDLCSEANRSGK